MKRRIIGKNKIRIMTALIFILISFMGLGGAVKAAEGGIGTESGSAGEYTRDWGAMVRQLDRAVQNGTGEDVNFLAGNHLEVPADILGKLAGKKAALALHTGNGVAFSISGGEIYRADTGFKADVSFESAVPDEVKAQIPADHIRREFSLETKEALPCFLNVHLALGEENAGRHAVLYSYNEADGTLRQEGIYRINAQGQAMFGLGRGDKYVVSVYQGHIVMRGETLSHIAAGNNVSLQALMAVNPQIRDADQIQIGQMVNLPK